MLVALRFAVASPARPLLSWHAHVDPRVRFFSTLVSNGRLARAMRRDEDFVDGAEFDDSDEPIVEESDDSDEYKTLPSLPSAPLRQALAEKSSSKRKARFAPDARRKTARSEKSSGLHKAPAYSWESAYQRSWDHVHEDESGSLESAVRHMLEASKRKRSLRDGTPVQRGIIRHFVLVIDLSADMLDRDLRPTRYVVPRCLHTDLTLPFNMHANSSSITLTKIPLASLLFYVRATA